MSKEVKEFPAGKAHTRTHPGVLLETLYLEPAGIGIGELAERIGVSRKAVSRVVNGKAAVSPEMAIKLGMALNTSPEYWLNLQRAYDLWQAEKELAKKKLVIRPFKRLAAA